MNRLVRGSALTYAAIGVAALARPAAVPAVFGGRAETADARTEIRAVYGGLPLAMAGLIASRPRSFTVPAAVLSVGMAAGRLAGVAIEEETGPPTRVFAAVELGLAAALLLGSRRG